MQQFTAEGFRFRFRFRFPASNTSLPLEDLLPALQAQLAAAASGGPTSSDGHSIDSVPTANEVLIPE